MTLPADMLCLEIDGHRFELTRAEWENLDCIESGAEEFHLIENEKTHTITVIDFDLTSLTCTLNVNGKIKKVSFIRDVDLMIEKLGLNSAQQKKISVLSAPMPGLVSSLKVIKGQEVEKGTPLIILEAMKMENVITAPHHAFVKEIKVTTGQAVDKGMPLIEFSTEG